MAYLVTLTRGSVTLNSVILIIPRSIQAEINMRKGGRAININLLHRKQGKRSATGEKTVNILAPFLDYTITPSHLIRKPCVWIVRASKSLKFQQSIGCLNSLTPAPRVCKGKMVLLRQVQLTPHCMSSAAA